MERVENMVFTSKSAEVKHLVLEFMGASEQRVSRNDIVKYVQDNVSVEVTDGVVAGAIKMLTCAGEIIPVQRGIYVKGTGKVKATSFEKITNLCKRFQLDLERACTVNILELTDHEKEVYPDFIRNLCQLRNDVQLGTACLDSLVEDVKLAESDIKDEPVETVELNVPALVENAGQENEKSVDEVNVGLQVQEESTSEENESAVDQSVETPVVQESSESAETVENETSESSTDTETVESEAVAVGAGHKKNRRNRH